MSFAHLQLPARPRLAAARKGAPRRNGFTLIEAAMATVIIGLGVLAMMQLLAAGTMVNARGTEQTTAINLAKNVRERFYERPFDELLALNNITYSPPIDSSGATVANMQGWQQSIVVESVDPNRITTAMADASPRALRLTITVHRHGRKVSDLVWHAFDPTP